MKQKKCKVCGTTKNLTRHSINGGHTPPFICLCEDCHRKEHGIRVVKTQYHHKNLKFKKGTKGNTNDNRNKN